MTLAAFLKKRPHLIWYTKNFNSLSPEAAVEAVLNYGDWGDVQDMIRILGIKKVAKIFHEKSNRPRSNYRPEIKHYFRLYFQRYAKYAQGNSH